MQHENLTLIKKRIKNAKNIEDIRRELHELQSYIDGKNYSQLTFFLFEQVIPSWYICFTDEDQQYLRDNFLDREVSVQIRFESITSLLVADILQDSSNAQLVCSCLKKLLERDFSALLAYISGTIGSATSNAFLQLLVSIPDRLANTLQKLTPDEFLPTNYYDSLLKRTLSYLNTNNQEKDFSCASSLISKLCKLGYSLQFVKVSLEYSPESMAKLLHNLPENLLESIVYYLLLELSKSSVEEASKSLVNILRNEIPTKSLQYIFTQKLFITKIFKKQTTVLLCYFLKQVSLTYSTIEQYTIPSILANIVNIWSDSLFIKNSSLSQQQNISYCTIELLKYVNKEDLMASQLVPKLIQGVQLRLESPQFPVRNQGMNVAAVFSTIIDPSNPLKFDEMIPDIHAESAEEEVVAKENKSQEVPKDNPKDVPAKKIRKPKKDDYFDDPDAPFFADDSSKQDNELEEEQEEEEEDELPTYNLEDEEVDLRSKVRVPVYLREALPALRSNNENVDQLEKSLNVLEKLIRNKPADIDEISENLATALLHLSDQYNLQNFEILRHKSLVALCVVSPKKSVKYLTSQFYEPNYNLQHRMDILDVLSDAAKELANVSQFPLAPATEEDNIPQNPTILNIVGHTTRRFTTRKPVVTAKNNFLPHASQFYFPLVQHYDDTSKSYMNLVASDSVVLSKLMYTLATFIECIGELVTADIIPIYKSLLDIIWALRYHEQVHVRRSVLFALLEITIFLGKDFMMNNFMDEITELRNWLEESIQVEQDEQLLQMTMSIQQLLSKKIAGELVQ